MSLNYEKHPEWYRDVPVMKTLILGSFPPHPDKWLYPFYYPNTINRFWKSLAEIAGIQLTHYTKKNKTPELEKIAVEERHNIMVQLQIGVQNMGNEIERKNKSAADTDIYIKTYADVLSIITQHPELTKILMPGFSAPSSTYYSFKNYLREKGIEIPQKPYAGMELEIYIDRAIKCVVLNSTSTATKLPYDIILNQFKKHLL